MRVLLIANTLPHTDISGVGEQVIQLAAGLRAQGHEVEILGRGPGGAFGPKVMFPFSVLPSFLRIYHRFRPHVIQVHESDGAVVGLVVRTLSAMQAVSPKLVALLQVSYWGEMRAVRSLQAEGHILGRPGLKELSFLWLKGPLQVAFGCLTAWLADQVLAPSRRTAGEIERDYRVSGVQVLPNVTGGRQSILQDPTGYPEPGYLLFVGRLRIRKGLEVLLHAMERTGKTLPELRLVVAGDGEHRQRLEGTISRLGLGKRVELLGRCDFNKVQTLMTRARALVVPSTYEGMPLVILEAMALGLPVVASSVSGIPEVVRDGETGWLVPAEDISALARVLSEIHDQPAELRRRGEAGQRWVRQEAWPSTVAKRWLELVGLVPARLRDETEVEG